MTRTTRARSSSARRFPLAGVESLEARALLNARSVAHDAASALAPAPAAFVAEVAHRQRDHHHVHSHPGGPRAEINVVAAPLGNAPIAAAGTASAPAGPYTPTQIRHAYGFDRLSQTGAGQTIAIVNAYDDPTIAADLGVFDQTYKLSAANLVEAFSGGAKPAFNAAWAAETALDVEWAHAIAPGAKILLVETPTNSLYDLLAGVDYAVAHGANQVSMSWAAPTFSVQTYFDPHFNHPGVSFLASAGDSAGAVSFPATSPYVTAVGGTTLQLDAKGRRLSETAWSSGGGGATAFEHQAGYQSVFATAPGRNVPDVSYNADFSTGYSVYDTSSGGTWQDSGGTSAGAPQWAALVALANQGRAALGKAPLGTGTTFGLNQVLYPLAGVSMYFNFHGDYYTITSGSNGNDATFGYSMAAGLGSPAANQLVPDLVRAK